MFSAKRALPGSRLTDALRNTITQLKTARLERRRSILHLTCKCVRMAPKKQDVMAWNRTDERRTRERGRKNRAGRHHERNRREKEKGSKLKIVGHAGARGTLLQDSPEEHLLKRRRRARASSSPLFQLKLTLCALVALQLTDCRRYAGP